MGGLCSPNFRLSEEFLQSIFKGQDEGGGSFLSFFGGVVFCCRCFDVRILCSHSCAVRSGHDVSINFQ